MGHGHGHPGVGPDERTTNVPIRAPPIPPSAPPMAAVPPRPKSKMQKSLHGL